MTSNGMTSTQNAHHNARIAFRLVGLLLATIIGVGLLGVTGGTAHADSGVAGVGFHTNVQCGGSFMLFTTTTATDSGSYAQLWAYDQSTGKWITDGTWQQANAWSLFHAPNISFEPGTYSVYMSYAQWTDSGWQYSGEALGTYTQSVGFSSQQSSTCVMGD